MNAIKFHIHVVQMPRATTQLALSSACVIVALLAMAPIVNVSLIIPLCIGSHLFTSVVIIFDYYFLFNEYAIIFSVAICSPECVNGDCVSPNTCDCDVGWTGSTCNEGELCLKQMG